MSQPEKTAGYGSRDTSIYSSADGCLAKCLVASLHRPCSQTRKTAVLNSFTHRLPQGKQKRANQSQTCQSWSRPAFVFRRTCTFAYTKPQGFSNPKEVPQVVKQARAAIRRYGAGADIRVISFYNMQKLALERAFKTHRDLKGIRIVSVRSPPQKVHSHCIALM